MNKNIIKKRRCECGGDTFVGYESNVVRGSFDESGTLLLKGYDALGVQDLKCEECGMKLVENFEIEFV